MNRKRGYPFLVTAGLCTSALAVSAAPPAPQSLLLGGPEGRPFRPANLDPHIPVGAQMRSVPRPELPYVACDVQTPVCAHAASAAVAERTRLLLVRAYRHLFLVRSLPPPLGDGDAGGGSELDLYLQPEAGRLSTHADLNLFRGDTTSGFCVAGPEYVDASIATRCLSELLALKLDAAESPALRGGVGLYESWLYDGPTDLAVQAVDQAQNNPQITLVGRDRHDFSDASALFFAYADQRWSAREPGFLPFALLQMSRRDETLVHPWPAQTAGQWRNAPDLMDITRALFDFERDREANFLSQWAVSRAFLGDRDDGAHGPGLGWLGPFGRVRFDWAFKASTLPRHVISNRAIEPLGSMYTWVELDNFDPGTRLGLRVTWEAPVRFQWVALALDRQGREVTRWEFTYAETQRTLEKTLMNFNGAYGLLIVGTNLGGVDLATPFDPDFEPWEPHRATVYLARVD